MLTHNSKPNLLFIITDQQRANAVGYVDKHVQTPNLDMLAQQSVNCTNTFVQSPQCQPSRASILTGRYPSVLGMWWNETALNKSEITLGNILQDAGYSTGYFGKMHIDGGHHTDVAKHFGFQESFLYEDWVKTLDTQHWDVDDRNHVNIKKEFFNPMQSEPWIGRLTDRRLHHEDVITAKALEFIKNASLPFCCFVGFHGPHPPYAAPNPFNDLYDPVSFDVPTNSKFSDQNWQTLKAQYLGMISWIDDNIGRLIKSVGNNTIIVFTSDHGDILGDHGYFSKGLYAYDGNTKVPLLIRLPNLSGEYRHLVQSIDIFPTLLETLGIECPANVQGKSLVNAFSVNKPVNSRVLSMIGFDPRLKMVRTNRFKYWYYGNEEYLYDLRRDPSELDNIVSSRSDVLSYMRRELIKALLQAEERALVPRS